MAVRVPVRVAWAIMQGKAHDYVANYSNNARYDHNFGIEFFWRVYNSGNCLYHQVDGDHPNHHEADEGPYRFGSKIAVVKR